MSEISDHEKILSSPCGCGSGKLLRDCHGGEEWKAAAEWNDMTPTPSPGAYATQDNASIQPGEPGPGDAVEPGPHPQVSLARPPVTRKIDLACGQSTREGFEGVDIWPGAQHVIDLQRYPWPFEDESVLEFNCSHYIEHIPMEMVRVHRPCAHCSGLGALHPLMGHDVNGTVPCPMCEGRGGDTGPPKDALFAFFDECYRILVPDGWLFIQVPAHRSDRAFQDPTHRRFITAQTFVYMNQDWRLANRLDHYNADCNFVGNVDPVIDKTLAMRHPDVAQQRIQRDWNTVLDWQARMQKKPRLPPKIRSVAS